MTEFSVTVSSSNRGLGGSFTGAGTISSGGGGGGGSSAAGVGAGTDGALAAETGGAGAETAGGFAFCCGRAFASDRPELLDLALLSAGSLAGRSTAGSAGAGTSGVGVTAGEGTVAVVQVAGASAPRAGALTCIARNPPTPAATMQPAPTAPSTSILGDISVNRSARPVPYG